jgi:hypothetical protein
MKAIPINTIYNNTEILPMRFESNSHMPLWLEIMALWHVAGSFGSV